MPRNTPTKIFFGKGQISVLKNIINRKHKILFLYGGGSIKSNGLYKEIIDNLIDYDMVEFSGIEANPEYETCLKAIEVMKDKKLDFILAVGGGSVIDAAKFIAVATKYKGDYWDDIIEKRVEITNAISLGTVLTIPATGSEMNGGCIISRRGLNKKRGFISDKAFPLFSILDPTVTYSLPSRQIANGVIDAFSHVMEQYLTFDQNTPLQDRFSEGILSTLMEEGKKVIHEPNNYNCTFDVLGHYSIEKNNSATKYISLLISVQY